jgi:hypothetical protein
MACMRRVRVLIRNLHTSRCVASLPHKVDRDQIVHLCGVHGMLRPDHYNVYCMCLPGVCGGADLFRKYDLAYIRSVGGQWVVLFHVLTAVLFILLNVVFIIRLWFFSHNYLR